jgi:hypothetical protein
MYRFLVRRGLARLIGGRAVPALMVWDLAVMANRARRIPVVDRTLRRSIKATRRRLMSAIPDRRHRPIRTGAVPDGPPDEHDGA